MTHRYRRWLCALAAGIASLKLLEETILKDVDFLNGILAPFMSRLVAHIADFQECGVA